MNYKKSGGLAECSEETIVDNLAIEHIANHCTLHRVESTAKLKPNCQPKLLHVWQNSTNCPHINLLKCSRLQVRQIQMSSHVKKCTKTVTTSRSGLQQQGRRLNNSNKRELGPNASNLKQTVNKSPCAPGCSNANKILLEKSSSVRQEFA